MNMRLKAILDLFALVIVTVSLNAAPNSAAAAETDLSGITKKVFPSVVRVEVQNTIRRVATGVVIDKEGHIVTTALVSPRDEKIFVITSEGDRVESEFLGMDVQTNLAVIKVKDMKLPPIEMGEMKDMETGSWVGVVGYSPENTSQATQGVVSSVSRDALRLNVWVWRGSSGSPVVDDKGRMIGLLRGVYIDESPVVIELGEKQFTGTGYMVSKVEAPSSGLAVAIPLPIVRDVSSEIEEKGKVERGWLGVLTREDEEGHLHVIEVTPDSPAGEAGLEEGDIIIELENMAVSGGEMLLNEVRSHKPGETVTLRIEREGKTQRVKVKLGEYTEQDIWREFEVKFPSLFNIPESQAFPDQMPRPFRFPFEGRIPGEKVGVWRPFESQKFIGVTIETLDEGLSEFFGLKEGVGILIRSVDKNGPADKAGIKVGDLIVKADGKRVETTDELVKLIHEKEKGEFINLEILRDKKKMTVEVEIDEDESLMSAVPFEHREQSVKKLESAGENVWKQSSGSNNWYFDEYPKTMRRFREEMKKLSETFLHEIKERSRETGFFWPTLI